MRIHSTFLHCFVQKTTSIFVMCASIILTYVNISLAPIFANMQAHYSAIRLAFRAGRHDTHGSAYCIGAERCLHFGC